MLLTAIKFMRYEKSKSIGITIGIVISIFLIGQQLSTLNFLKSLMCSISTHTNRELADIWVITDQSTNLNAVTPINSSLVNELKSIDGVEETFPVVYATTMMKFSNGQFSSVLLIGSEDPILILRPNGDEVLDGKVSNLSHPRSIALDKHDQKGFKHPVDMGMDVELNGKHAKVEVLMNHVRGYGASFCYTSLNNAREFTGMSPNLVSAIIIKADNHYEISDVCNRINRSFPGIRAWNRNELEKRTIKTILRESNMGVSFGSLVIFAVISGFFIIGLTLYTSTFDRVKDYGTLKAIGATNGYISRLVLLQAFLYAVVGYVIAVILLFMMKFGVAKSGLSLIIPPELLVELFLLTTFISVGGSFFAVAKLKKLEPASVFK